jgi:DNA-binding response OmpR family regulator
MKKLRILVADDEPHLVRSLTFLMSRAGYEVYSAENGEEALRKANECRPELIFLDIMMPRKNGFEVCEAIRQTPELKNPYIIMLSAKGREIDRAKALSVGADEFMSKPFSPLEIVARVKDIADFISTQQKEGLKS